MFEFLIVCAAILFGGIYLFRFLFFLIGLLFSGVGFIIKAMITIVLAFLFFPVTIVFAGGLLSSGLIGLLFFIALFGALTKIPIRKKKYY